MISESRGQSISTDNMFRDGPRNNNFDLLRFAAAVLVIFSHCFPLVRGRDRGYEPLDRLTDHRLTLGVVAVYIFFAISGFLITRSWEQCPNLVHYLRKRAARIVPGYVCATLLCVLLIGPVFANCRLDGTIALSGLFTLLRLSEVIVRGAFPHNPFPGHMYGSVWTIQYEAACYLGLALLGCLGAMRKRWIALAIFLLDLGVCAFLSIADRAGWSVSLDPTYPRLLAYFGAGMVFYLYRERVPTKPWALILAVALIAAGFIAPMALDVALPLGGCYLLFWSAFQPRFKLRDFAKHGDYSYGIYLYAFPIQQILISLSPAAWSPLGLFAVATPASILGGGLSWHLVEKHFLTKRTHRAKAKGTESNASFATPGARRASATGI